MIDNQWTYVVVALVSRCGVGGSRVGGFGVGNIGGSSHGDQSGDDEDLISQLQSKYEEKER